MSGQSDAPKVMRTSEGSMPVAGATPALKEVLASESVLNDVV